MKFYKTAAATAFLIALVGTPVWGQTSRQLAARYPLVPAYELRPGILMTAKYASDGQLCEAVLETRHYRSTEVDLGSTIPSNLREQLIDELAPVGGRGKATKSRWLSSDIGGGVIHTTLEYENVSIELYGSYKLAQSRTFKARRQESPDSGGDEVIVIRWKRRACAVPGNASTVH
jgi:hypothetical protein